MSVSARENAVRQLERIEQQGTFIGLLSGDEAGQETDARAERQATEYVAGVTRGLRWLDFLIQSFYKGDLGKMEPRLRQILRIGLYDFLYLDTPPHAAIHEAVELAKRLVRAGAGGLGNGILRSVQRSRDKLPEPHTGDPAEDLAIRHSHPTWMVRRWLERYGPESTGALLAWNNERPVYGLRINTLKTGIPEVHAALDELGVAWEPSPYLDYFVRIRQLQPVIRAGWLSQGLCAVQDESAGLVTALLDPQPGETLVDGCAAPGGKALHAAQRMQGRGRILAYDVHGGRLRLLSDTAPAHGVTIIETEAADLRDVMRRPDHPAADRVLLDAPCSGLGVLSKRADLRWNRTLEEIKSAAALQDELLDASAMLVRPGGLLVYSTCTIEPEENEHRVAAFLARHAEFSLEPAHGLVPPETITADGFFSTLPPRDRVDGAFGARLRKGKD